MLDPRSFVASHKIVEVKIKAPEDVDDIVVTFANGRRSNKARYCKNHFFQPIPPRSNQKPAAAPSLLDSIHVRWLEK